MDKINISSKFGINDFKKEKFLKDIFQKFGNIINDDNLEKTFLKKNKLNIENLLNETEINFIKENLENKKIVLLKDETIDSNAGVNNIIDILKKKLGIIDITVISSGKSGIISYNKIKDELLLEDKNFKNYFFISLGNVLNNFNKIKDITELGGKMLVIDNIRIGNDYIPKKDIEYFRNKNSKNLVIANQYLSDYSNKNVSISVLGTKIFTYLSDKKISGVKNIYSDKIKILNGLSIISDISNINTYENNIIIQEMLESLNNISGKGAQDKIKILKEALKIDEFDIENVNSKLLPFIFNLNNYYKGYSDEERSEYGSDRKDYIEILDYLFEDNINEEEFKSILRTVLYIQDKNRVDFSEKYTLFQTFLYGILDKNNIIKNLYFEYDENKGCLLLDGHIFPNDQFINVISYYDVKKIFNKYKNENFVNIFLTIKKGKNVFIETFLIEKMTNIFKKYIKNNKGDILKIGGEDFSYSFIFNGEKYKNFFKYIEENTQINDNIKTLNSIEIDDFSYLTGDILKIIKRDLGIINPGKINYSIYDVTLYSIKKDLDKYWIEVKDKKGNKRKIFLNEYFYKYINENNEIGDNLSLYLKANIITKSNGEIDVGFYSPSIIKNLKLSFNEIKKIVDLKLGDYQNNFKMILKNFDEKGSYELIYHYIINEGLDIKEALINTYVKLMELNEIADENGGSKIINGIKNKINDFIINKDQSLDYMLNLEKDRITFGGSNILPFLIKGGNQIFLVNNEDRFYYNKILDKRNRLFFKGEEILNWYKENFGEIKDISNKESIKYLETIRDILKGKINSRNIEANNFKKNLENNFLSKESIEIKINNDLKITLELIKKYNEIKTIISQLKSLKTSFRNNIHTKYMKFNSLKYQDNLNFSDIFLNKERIKEMYFNDKINNKQFYNNFYDFDHFFQTAKLVVGNNKMKFTEEIISFLNNNSYNSIFDTIINNIKNGTLDDKILNSNFYNGLSLDSKNRFLKLIDNNIIHFQKIFHINILETDDNKIRKEILEKFGILEGNKIDLDNKKKINERLNYVLSKKEEIIKHINDLIKNIKYENIIKGNKIIKGKSYKKIIDFLNNGEIDGKKITEIINTGLTLTKNIDNGFLVLAYLRDLGLKGKNDSSYSRKGEFLGDRKKSSILNNDLIFLKLDEFDFFFKILGNKNKEWKDNLLFAHEKELLKVIGELKLESKENRYRGIVNYYKNIFNIYKLDVPFISNQLINSGLIFYVFNNLKDIYNELLKEYNIYLNKEKIIENGNILSFNEFLRNKILTIGDINKDGTYTPKHDTIFASNLGVRKFNYYTLIYEFLKVNGTENIKLDNFRRFVSGKMGKHIKQDLNNYGTSQSESYFIFNIQRKLDISSTIEKPGLDYSYKDIIKELFGLLDEDKKNKIYNIISKTNSYGKNLLPDFIIRNKDGNIIGIGEIYGGNSNDKENYEETKKIKNDILNIFKEVGINIFTVNYDEKDKMKYINNFLININYEVNKGKKSKLKSLKSYNDFISKNNLKDIIEGKEYIKINPDNINKNITIPINKYDIQILINEKNNGRKLIFFDTETTGFGRKGDPLSFNLGSIFQLAYSNNKGEYISEEFKEIRGPLTKKIEDLTHRKRSTILDIGKDPNIGITNLLYEIIGPELSEQVKSNNKKLTINSFLKNRHKFGILIGHNSFAFDAPMLGNMIKYIYMHKSYQQWFKENPNIYKMYSYFVKYGFDMGDTLNYSREILNGDKNYFLGNFEIGNKNYKLGNLYYLSQIKKAEIEGKDLNKFKKELEEKILKNAHNAQFDIEMTKEVYEYIENVYINGNKTLEKESNDLFNSLINGKFNFREHYNTFRNKMKIIKESKINIEYYNKLIKLVVLQLGKTDLKIILDNKTGKFSLHRLSEYTKYKLDSNKLKESLNLLGLTEGNINEMGLINEKITKSNTKILTSIIENLITDDENIDIYDVVGEKLHLNFNIKREELNLKIEETFKKLQNEIGNIKENELIIILNELVEIKEKIYSKYKKNIIDFKKYSLITEQLLKKIFEQNNEKLNKLELLLKEKYIFLDRKFKKIYFYGKEDFNDIEMEKFTSLNIKLKKDEKTGFVEIIDIDEFNKNGGGKLLNQNKNIFKLEYGNKIFLGLKGNKLGSYSLTNQTIVNIEKIQKLISLKYITDLDTSILKEMIKTIIDTKVNNKNIIENFKNSKEMFEKLALSSVDILRSSNYIRK